jgi:hypothetical protein
VEPVGWRMRGCGSAVLGCVSMAFCEPRHCSAEVCGWRGEAGFGAWALGLLFVLR